MTRDPSFFVKNFHNTFGHWWCWYCWLKLFPPFLASHLYFLQVVTLKKSPHHVDLVWQCLLLLPWSLLGKMFSVWLIAWILTQPGMMIITMILGKLLGNQADKLTLQQCLWVYYVRLPKRRKRHWESLYIYCHTYLRKLRCGCSNICGHTKFSKCAGETW